MYPYGYSVGILSPGDEVKDGVIHFGIEDGPIEVHFKPLEDSDAAAVYKLDIE